MATVFKRKRSRPIPAGAEITIVRGKRVAVWLDKTTNRRRRAPLTADGKRIEVEDTRYTIEWFDEHGKRRKCSAGTSDRDAAMRYAQKLETEAMLRRRGIIDANAERLTAEGRRSIEDHLGDFKAKLRAAGRSRDHIDRTIKFCREIVTAAGFTTLNSISADGVNGYATKLFEKGRSARTVQAHLTAIKSFTRWLAKEGKLPADPLASVEKPNPKIDRRHERRMLLHEEWAWLQATIPAEGVTRHGMSPAERVLLYAVAIQTGLRANELRSLTRKCLYLDEDQPFITCKAGNTKNHEDARQYIKRDVAAALRRHLANRPGANVFSMPSEYALAEMLRQDVRAARARWLAEVADDAAALQQREQSDFLADINHEGHRLDFHCLRHTCGAWLAMAGVHPKVVQTVMRHSVITLTMDTYGHLFPGQEAEAINRLPDMLDDPPDDILSDGPDQPNRNDPPAHGCGQQIGQQSGGKSCAPMATAGNFDRQANAATCVATAIRNSCSSSNLGNDWPPLASVGNSSRGGIRTRTGGTPQGILSPQRLPFRHSAQRVWNHRNDPSRVRLVPVLFAVNSRAVLKEYGVVAGPQTPAAGTSVRRPRRARQAA